MRWPLLTLIIVLVTTFVGVVALVHTPPGNDFLAARAQSLISSEIPGRIEIVELRHLEGLSFRAKKVRFYAPKVEQPVLDLDGVELTLASSSFFKGALIAPHASVVSGIVRLRLAPSGRTTLEEALSAPDDKSEPPEASNPLEIAFQRIDVRKTTFDVALNEFKFRAQGLHGHISIERDPKAPGVDLTIHELKGQHTQPELIGNKFALRNLKGQVLGNRPKVVDLRGVGHSENNTVPFHLRYWSDPEVRVKFNINRDQTSFTFDIATTMGDIFVVPDFVELTFDESD